MAADHRTAYARQLRRDAAIEISVQQMRVRDIRLELAQRRSQPPDHAEVEMPPNRHAHHGHPLRRELLDRLARLVDQQQRHVDTARLERRQQRHQVAFRPRNPRRFDDVNDFHRLPSVQD